MLQQLSPVGQISSSNRPHEGKSGLSPGFCGPLSPGITALLTLDQIAQIPSKMTVYARQQCIATELGAWSKSERLPPS